MASTWEQLSRPINERLPGGPIRQIQIENNNKEPLNMNDGRHHVNSMLMRESLLDKDVQKSTETPVFSMLPEAYVVKIGGRSIIDAGRSVVYPVIDVLASCLKTKKLIIGAGGGVRARHVL